MKGVNMLQTQPTLVPMWLEDHFEYLTPLAVATTLEVLGYGSEYAYYHNLLHSV